MTLGVISLYIGGALHIAWAIFHLMFPRIFKWPERLAELDPLNRAIYQVLNLCLVFGLAAVAYLSFTFAPDLIGSPLGRKILGIIGVFWLFRTSLQFRFFAKTHPVSLFLVLMFLITACTYFIPLFKGGA